MSQRTHLRPREAAKEIGVSVETVLKWIHDGRLAASNISEGEHRPRWLISRTDLDEFLGSLKPKQKPTSKRPLKIDVPNIV